jgi:regulator of protease activity HflC (stomatin/prohibitin superfamily)
MEDRVAHFSDRGWRVGETVSDYLAAHGDAGNLPWSQYAIAGTVAVVVIGVVVALARKPIRVAAEYLRSVVFRLGRFSRIAGPGLFFLVPILERVQKTVSLQVEATSLTSEKVLTHDAVSVSAMAVVFWRVSDPKQAVLAVEDYAGAVRNAANAALLETIGGSALHDLLGGRQAVDARMAEAIARRVTDWGVTVDKVDLQDIRIPQELEDAMSRNAQAQQESRARVTLAAAEVDVARKTAEAAAIYDQNPTALRLRQMGLVYEMGQNSNTILVPTEMAGAMAAITAASPRAAAP